MTQTDGQTAFQLYIRSRYNFHYVSSHTKGKYVAIDLDSTVIQSLSNVDITGSVGGASSSTSYSNFYCTDMVDETL